jgi:hypothetical protein
VGFLRSWALGQPVHEFGALHGFLKKFALTFSLTFFLRRAIFCGYENPASPHHCRRILEKYSHPSSWD